ncbi:MAG: NAD(P)-dependent oxidoreductase [Clostridium sp.]|nr:NAD(P)-dependent oxidoreductase [Clostridium sp.]
MKVFMTGGTGNIGQNITMELLRRGHTVTLLTRTPERIPAYQTMDGVEVVKGNILELDVMEKAMEGCDAVVHVALGWGNTPVEMLRHDTLITCFLAETAEKLGMEKMIYTSSTAAMGPLRDGMGEEAKLLPDNLYGATKASAEMFLLGFRQYYSGQGIYGEPVKLKRNIIRPGYIFSNPAVEGGASQSDTRFLDMAKAVVENRNVEVAENDGTQFLSGAQIAKLYGDLLESDLNEEVFLALGKKFVSWEQIARWTKELVPESTSEIIVKKSGSSEGISYYNTQKITDVFGFNFDGDEDLKAHVAWNVERAKRQAAGETLDNVYHVW